MKQALQAILVAPDPKQRLSILLGDIFLTVREGHRDYKTGPVMICCHLVPWAIMATITGVRHTIVQEVTEEELKAGGFASHEEMLNDLRKYYSNLTMESPVTVISWGNITGALAEKEKVWLYAKKHHLVEMLIEY